MPPQDKSTPEELAAAREARVAARRLEVQERYLALLRLAQRVRQDNSLPPETLAGIIAAGEGELASLKAHTGGRIVGRRRPVRPGPPPPPTCTIFLDECGAHSLRAKDELEAFCLATIIVPDDQYDSFNKQWCQWKQITLGSANKIVHEPDVRKGRGSFGFRGNKKWRTAARESLRRQLEALDFQAIVCVVNRPEYLKLHGMQALDESLPTHIYLMTLHFVAERLALTLDTQFKGAKGRLVAESRGPLEDALLQYDFVRLQIDGTSYVSAAFFRQQLCPGIDFKSKRDNESGLQIADLLARPCAEKVLNPASTPDRWPEFRGKLCQGQETAHSILGLKVVPWDERYVDIWKS